MKTNRLLFAMLAVVAGAMMMLASCGGDDGHDPGGTTYNVTVSVTGNTGGTVKATVDGATVTKAKAGATVTIEATPAASYEFTGWMITASNANLSSTTSSTTTFNMPEDNVSIEAAFGQGTTINGVVWASRNVDAFGTFAATAQDAGMFYQWNRSKAWPATGSVSDWVNSNAAGDSWAAENDPCPEGWRVPTRDDFSKLADESKVTGQWSASPAGCKYTDKGSHNSIFLPAAGCRGANSGGITLVGNYGYYWASTPHAMDNGYATCFTFYSGNPGSVGTSTRAQGYPVRCVKQ